MQTVNATFTAEERDSVRKPVVGLNVSWKKELDPSIGYFTIGISAIGGVDLIADGQPISDWRKYRYFNESDYLTSVAWERELNEPTGGVVKGLIEADLENTTNRFTPYYLGGTDELFTALIPRRPLILNAGFNYLGINHMLPQFVGITTKNPNVDMRNRMVKIEGADFIDYLQNSYLDTEVMFTSKLTDQVMESVLLSKGYMTADYEFDPGINLVPFGYFEAGTKLGDMFQKLLEAENGHLYQDEEGVIRFENRQHWTNAPHTNVQRIIFTADVINYEAPNTDHIINVVEVKGKPRAKQSNQLIFTLSQAIAIPALSDYEYWVTFDDPMLEIDAPVYVAYDHEDRTGVNITTSVYVKSSVEFAKTAKYVFHNNSTTKTAYITDMTLYGRPAKVAKDIYVRVKDESSITAYEERPYVIENEYIDELYAQSIGQMILDDYGEPQNLQVLTIRAIPELQLGDCVSWQGRTWITYGIKNKLSPSEGYIQEIKVLKRDIKQYFRIGISAIGGTDYISP